MKRNPLVKHKKVKLPKKINLISKTVIDNLKKIYGKVEIIGANKNGK